MVLKNKENYLYSFFLRCFLFSWTIWVILLLDHINILTLDLEPGIVLLGRVLGTLGPALGALSVSFQSGGYDSVEKIIIKLKRWRVGHAWIIAAILVYPGLVFISAGLYSLLFPGQVLPIQSANIGAVLVTSFFMIISVLGEEIGWRGFALPLLQERWSALKSSLVLGSIWTIWHLPFWALLDELSIYGWWYWFLSWAFISSGSVYITWLMNNTGDSLFSVVLFHWSYNILSVVYFPITSVIPAYVIFIGLSWLIALGLVIYFGSDRLVKK